MRYFANVATDSFLGSLPNSIGQEGNPWKWHSDKWNLKEDFDVNGDFPSITEWESTLTAASHNLCFRHKGEKKSSIELRTQSNMPPEDEIDSNLSRLRHHFPNTPHSVYIAESIKCLMRTLNHEIHTHCRKHEGSPEYINNGISFRYILHQLSNYNMEFHDVTMLLLYALPSKSNDCLREKIFDINDVIRHIREQSPALKLTIHYITIFQRKFDFSQESYVSSQEN